MRYIEVQYIKSSLNIISCRFLLKYTWPGWRNISPAGQQFSMARLEVQPKVRLGTKSTMLVHHLYLHIILVGHNGPAGEIDTCKLPLLQQYLDPIG